MVIVSSALHNNLKSMLLSILFLVGGNTLFHPKNQRDKPRFSDGLMLEPWLR